MVFHIDKLEVSFRPRRDITTHRKNDAEIISDSLYNRHCATDQGMSVMDPLKCLQRLSNYISTIIKCLKSLQAMASNAEDKWEECSAYREKVKGLDISDELGLWSAVNDDMMALSMKFRQKLENMHDFYVGRLKLAVKIAKPRPRGTRKTRSFSHLVDKYEFEIEHLDSDLEFSNLHLDTMIAVNVDDFETIYGDYDDEEKRKHLREEILQYCDPTIKQFWIKLGEENQSMKDRLSKVGLRTEYKIFSTIEIAVPADLEQQIELAFESVPCTESGESKNAEMILAIGKDVVATMMRLEVAKVMMEISGLYESIVIRIQKDPPIQDLHTILMLYYKVTSQMVSSHAIVNKELDAILAPSTSKSCRCEHLVSFKSRFSRKGINENDIMDCLEEYAKNVASTTRQERAKVVDLITTLSCELELINH